MFTYPSSGKYRGQFIQGVGFKKFGVEGWLLGMNVLSSSLASGLDMYLWTLVSIAVFLEELMSLESGRFAFESLLHHLLTVCLWGIDLSSVVLSFFHSEHGCSNPYTLSLL